MEPELSLPQPLHQPPRPNQHPAQTRSAARRSARETTMIAPQGCSVALIIICAWTRQPIQLAVQLARLVKMEVPPQHPLQRPPKHPLQVRDHRGAAATENRVASSNPRSHTAEFGTIGKVTNLIGRAGLAAPHQAAPGLLRQRRAATTSSLRHRPLVGKVTMLSCQQRPALWALEDTLTSSTACMVGASAH